MDCHQSGFGPEGATWWNNPCWQAQTSDVSCSWSPGLHTSQEGFWSTPLCRISPNPYVAFSIGGNEVQAQYSTVHGPIHSPLDAVKSSCTLGRETAPKHNVSTSIIDGGDGVLGVIFSILPPRNVSSRVDAKELDFGLI